MREEEEGNIFSEEKENEMRRRKYLLSFRTKRMLNAAISFYILPHFAYSASLFTIWTCY